MNDCVWVYARVSKYFITHNPSLQVPFHNIQVCIVCVCIHNWVDALWSHSTTSHALMHTKNEHVIHARAHKSTGCSNAGLKLYNEGYRRTGAAAVPKY